jgi:predicted dehydrogenase
LAHLHSFLRVPNCEVAALAEAKPLLRQKVADHHHIPRRYASHEELLADARVDAVVCSQPFHRNYELGMQVLKAGKHLFTEKPMAGRLDDATALVELARQRGLIYAVGFMKRYDPGVLLAQESLQQWRGSGELGAMTSADVTCFLGDWLQNPGEPIRTDEPDLGHPLTPRYPDHLADTDRPHYDHFLNIYSHTVNLLHFLLPQQPISCLSAHRSGRSYLVALGSGDLLISLRGAPSRSHQWEESACFHFERGRLELHNPTPLNRQKVGELVVVRHAGKAWSQQRLFPPVEWAFYRQAKASVEAVAGGPPPAASGQACLADVALMEQIFLRLREP